MKSVYIIVFVLVSTVLISAKVPKKKSDVESMLIGVWVMKQGQEKECLRYVRADKFEKNVRGIEFKEDGTAILYEAFGCQMPLPNYRPWNASWKVKNRSTVIIDRKYPGEKPDKMKVEKLTSKVFKFNWD
jgi:hypothetical protein